LTDIKLSITRNKDFFKSGGITMTKKAIKDTIRALMAEMDPKEREELVREETYTGEGKKMIVAEFNEGDKVIIRNEQQQERAAKHARFEQSKQEESKTPEKHWTATFLQNNDDHLKELSLNDAALLFKLTMYLRKHSKGLLMSTDTIPLTQKDIQQNENLSGPTVSTKMQKFVKLGFLFEEKVSYWSEAKIDHKSGMIVGDPVKVWVKGYRMNGNFHWMGEFETEMKSTFWTKTYKKVLEDRTEHLSDNARGLLYFLVNKIHYQNNSISNHPSDELRLDLSLSFLQCVEMNLLKPTSNMNMNDLMALTRMKKSQLNELLAELDDFNLVKKFGAGKNAYFIANSRFFRRIAPGKEQEKFSMLSAVAHQFDQAEPSPYQLKQTIKKRKAKEEEKNRKKKEAYLKKKAKKEAGA
jgi:hypothetical protein